METPDSSSNSAKPARKFSLFSLRTFGCGLVGLAGLATLIALFFAEEDWRGKHAWETYRRQAEARGVELDFQKFIPAPVPDEQNFAMTPFLAPLFDFNPQPLQPGQTRWRDTNGYNRAMGFATNFNWDLGTNRPASVIVSGRFTDFDALAHSLLKKSGVTNSFASRTEAAQAVLDFLNQYHPVLDEIQTASRRPYSRFNISYNDEDPAAILLPHLAMVKKLNQIVQFQASAELALGHNDLAFEKLKLMIYLTDSTRDEPFIITHLVRMAMASFSRQVIWEGLAEGRWTDAQLRGFQASLSGWNLAKEARESLDAERAGFGVRLFDYIRKNRGILNNGFGEGGNLGNMFEFAPSGWLYLEQISYHRLYEQKILPGLDAATGRVYPQIIDKNVAGDGSMVSHFWHHDVLGNMLLPALGSFYRKVAVSETAANETMIACALERYRLANGKLPATLDLLAPQFLDHVPLDVCNGQPLIYRPLGDRDFALYSVGWNETDDGGTTVLGKGTTPSPDSTQGDWVWPQYSGK